MNDNVRWVRSEDGSYTAYSSEYDEHYHSTKDGALNESFKKHVEPAFALHAGKRGLRIIDICFGLGLNTLATLHYRDTRFPDTMLDIFSPELDGDLVASLVDFPYPEIFEPYRTVIAAIARTGRYEDERTRIVVRIADARIAIRELSGVWDVWYQDAFSPGVNPILWTKEFFADAARLLGEEGILTTYSTALATRLALHQNGFWVYLNRGEGYRNATIATRRDLKGYERVDMAHKIACNPLAAPLSDENPDL